MLQDASGGFRRLQEASGCTGMLPEWMALELIG